MYLANKCVSSETNEYLKLINVHKTFLNVVKFSKRYNRLVEIAENGQIEIFLSGNDKTNSYFYTGCMNPVIILKSEYNNTSKALTIQ